MFLTIITPVYNRAYTIEKLYNSLLKQECRDFVWLVIDDGSTDNIEEVINTYIREGTINIKYIKKENGGKHTAVNKALEYVNSDLTIIVDSDDYLTSNSIETIKTYYQKYKNNNKIGFYSFLRINGQNKILCKAKKNEFIGNYLKVRIKQNVKGDMAEVFVSSVLKKYRFAVFENEKFISEDTLWIELAKKYDTLFVNKPIYVCDYLIDGITLNDKKTKFKSPLGSMLRGKQLMNKECGFIMNVKGAIIYNCYYLDARETDNRLYLENSYQKNLVFITKPLGFIFNKKWKKGIK